MDECIWCNEGNLNAGDLTNYGASIVYKRGGWFATLSPKTGGDVNQDFSIQLMPVKHLKYFSDIHGDDELAKNYGIAFAKISKAIAEVIGTEGGKIPIGTYGKCKHEDEHMHVKLFPYRGDVGQPFTVDSSFGKKERHNDGEEFVKMRPVEKVDLSKERFDELTRKFLELLKE